MPDGLLLLYAHPDDESFSAAGAAARYADAGRRVALVCATRGQAGSAGEPPLATRAALPQVREAELRAACAILGIDVLAVLDHEDKRLAEADAEGMRRALVRAVRAERPAVVCTFDPHGVTGHADHVAISRFTLDAIGAAADARYRPELGAAHAVRRVVWPSPVLPWDEWRPDALARTWGVDYLLDVRAGAARKARALRAHRTQHQSVDRLWFGEQAARTGGDVLAYETFRHGWGERPPRTPAADLFEGL